MPALYKLVADKKVGNFALIGAARESSSMEHVIQRSQEHLAKTDPAIWQQLAARCSYVQVDVTQYADIARLHEHVKKVEQQFDLPGNRMVYCAVSSEFFCSITSAVAQSGLLARKEESSPVWHRIVYEKPFGRDAESAHAINACIAQHFNESQVYRIDHYLSHDLVSNIALMRFTNCIFEPLWNNQYIENVQIVLSEKTCVGGRGQYYDTYGALRDVVQNHMMELVALIGMEAPAKLTGEHIRAERVRVLEKVSFTDGVLGQYDGYHDDEGIAPGSTTETFAALQLQINNPRWQGVPFYLKTGKCLPEKETIIHIKFRQVECLLSQSCPSDSNYLTIRIQPNAAFFLSLNTKRPGRLIDVVPINMEFFHSHTFGPMTPEAYEVVLEEIMAGQQAVSVRFDEIECAWKAIDALRAMNLPLYHYAQGSTGPKEVEQFAHKHGMRWRS